jgi:hypothetical protein
VKANAVEEVVSLSHMAAAIDEGLKKQGRPGAAVSLPYQKSSAV